MQQLTTYLQCLILDNNNIIDMIDNFISEFSITNSWNAEKWSRLMEDVKNMTDGDSRKRSMRKLRAIVLRRISLFSIKAIMLPIKDW